MHASLLAADQGPGSVARIASRGDCAHARPGARWCGPEDPGDDLLGGRARMAAEVIDRGDDRGRSRCASRRTGRRGRGRRARDSRRASRSRRRCRRGRRCGSRCAACRARRSMRQSRPSGTRTNSERAVRRRRAIPLARRTTPPFGACSTVSRGIVVSRRRDASWTSVRARPAPPAGEQQSDRL